MQITQSLLLTLAVSVTSCGGSKDTSKVPSAPPVAVDNLQPTQTPVEDSKPLKVAHRGLYENTIDGFIYSIEQGYTILETDVRLWRGELILAHDKGPCPDCATLFELLNLAQHEDVSLWIEFKETRAIDPALALISQYNIEVLLTSYKVSDLEYLNSASDYPLGYITYPSNQEVPFVDWILANDASYCTEFQKCGIWTIKSQQDFDIVAGYDIVDAIIVDDY